MKLFKAFLVALLLCPPALPDGIPWDLHGLQMVCFAIDKLPIDFEKREWFKRAKFETALQLQLRRSGVIVTSCSKNGALEWKRILPGESVPHDVSADAVPRLLLSISVFSPRSDEHLAYDISLDVLELTKVMRSSDPVWAASWHKAVYGEIRSSQIRELRDYADTLVQSFVNDWLGDNPPARPTSVFVPTKHIE